MRALSAAALVVHAAAHGKLEIPQPRQLPEANASFWCDMSGGRPPRDASCFWSVYSAHYLYSSGCYAGCPSCVGSSTTPPSSCSLLPAGVQCCPTTSLVPTTIDSKHQTYKNETMPDKGINIDPFPYRPWRSPGFAPVIDPCGVVGGFNHSHSISYLDGNGGYPPEKQRGLFGSNLPASPNKVTWKAGSTAEVAWSLVANHGGGYQYRLCPKGQKADEACFQKLPLTPVGDSWLQYGPSSNRGKVSIKADRVTDGVNPAGSTWTKNPVPSCIGTTGGAAFTLCLGANFEPPAENAYGFGTASCLGAGVAPTPVASMKCSQSQWEHTKKWHDFSIHDTVQVPAGLSGDYVLSWRWDAEQSSQVWANCADITIA